MFAPVNGPPAAAPRVGLLTAAPRGEDSVPWDKGIISWPESTGGWRVVADCTTQTDDHGLDDDPQLPVGLRPIVIQTRVRDLRTSVEEMAGRAKRRLEAITSKALAVELRSGGMTRLDPYTLPGRGDYANPSGGSDEYTNPYLEDSRAELHTGPLPLPAAVGEVEARLGELLAGGTGHVHIAPEYVLELAQFLDRRGDVLYTPLGNVIVPDAGYAGMRTIYGTDAVTWWTGPSTVLDDPSQVVSYRDNSIEVYAERPAAALFNPQTLVGCPVEVS